jgi:predicted lipoprotein
VRPIEKPGAGRFDAGRYVESIWDSKVVKSETLAQGTGRVVRVEPETLWLEGDVAVLTGGGIRGTALRDALPFIQFSQFTNQLEFARVGNALNDRAARAAQAAIGGPDVVGWWVRYKGAATRRDAVTEIVPVMLAISREKP